MKRHEIQVTMERIRDARLALLEATRDINAQADQSMKRLLFEAAQNRMSVDEVSKFSGLTKRRIRELMRKYGMDPKWSKTLLSKHASAALEENAELLGIDPVDMDLMSPLAYLPAGEALRTAVLTTRQVHELPEEPVATGLWCETCEFFEQEILLDGRCASCGCEHGTHLTVHVVRA